MIMLWLILTRRDKRRFKQLKLLIEPYLKEREREREREEKKRKREHEF